MFKSIYKISAILAVTLFILPIFVHATDNAGLVDGIWLSKQIITEDEPIIIFAALQNQTSTNLEGSVIFFDSGVAIGTVLFNVPSNNFNLVTLQHKFKTGSHSISASITSNSDSGLIQTKLPSKNIAVLEKPEPVELFTIPDISTSTITEAAKVAVDTAVDTSVKTGNVIFDTVDPKAQDMAQNLREKSSKFSNETITTEEGEQNIKINDKNKKRLNQMAAVGLSALAFGFENWLWHLALAGVLMIIRNLYRRRLN